MQVLGQEHSRHDAVVVVRTPFQLLSATEARHHFAFARPLLYLLTSTAFPKQRFDSLIDPHDWAAIRYFDVGIERRVLRHHLLGSRLSERLTELRWVLVQSAFRLRFDREFRRWSDAPNLIIGNYYNPDLKHLASMFRGSRCILVDDGTDTLRIARARRDAVPVSTAPQAPPFVLRAPKRWWHERFVEWDTREREEVTFFSSYDIQASPRDVVVHNSFRRIRGTIRKPRVDGRCMFLGQPLVDDGYLRLESYLDLMMRIKQSMGRHEMIYVPHPREDKQALSGSLAKLGISCQEISKPFELYLLDAESVPGTLASFFCSALESCRGLWDDAMLLVAFRIPEGDLLACRDFVSDVYDYFAGTGSIRVVTPGDPLDISVFMTERGRTAQGMHETHRE